MEYAALIFDWLRPHKVAIMAILQSLAWLIAAIGGTIAAFKAVVEMRKANKEREEARGNEERDLRWRKAEMSKKLLDETFSNQRIVDAFNIADFDEWDFKDGEKTQKILAKHADMPKTLRVVDMDLNDDEVAIRDRFDAMLLQFGHIEHYINIGLVIASDIMSPLEYYAERCADHEAAISKYGESLGAKPGIAFLRRFPVYTAQYELRSTQKPA